MIFNKTPEKPQQISISDLISQCNSAASTMSAKNGNRILIMNCAYALRQLVDRLALHEAKTSVQ